MLTRDDLDEIRAIVRDEVEIALQRNRERITAENLIDAPADETNQYADLEAWARADARAVRGKPGASREARILEARYRARHDGGFQRRARKTLGMKTDAIVSEADMLRAMRFWDEAKAERAKR